MSSCVGFLCTFCVWLSMFSELERLRLWARGPCDHHMTVAWLSRQLIRSESVVSRRLLNVKENTSYYHSSLLELRSSFHSLVIKTGGKYTVYTIWTLKSEPTLVVVEVESTDVVESTDIVLERERFVWCRVNLLVTRETVWWHGSSPVTRGDRDLVPARPSTRWTWVDSPFDDTGVDIRSGVRLQSCLLLWQMTDLPERHVIEAYLFLLFVYFVNPW